MKTLIQLTPQQDKMIVAFAVNNDMNPATLTDAATKLAELPAFLFPSESAWMEWEQILDSLAVDHNITSA